MRNIRLGSLEKHEVPKAVRVKIQQENNYAFRKIKEI